MVKWCGYWHWAQSSRGPRYSTPTAAATRSRMICMRAVARAVGARNSRCFAKIAGGEVRKGHTLELKGRLVRVTAVERVKPGKGGAYAQLELRDVRSGAKRRERLATDAKVERAELDARRECALLYVETAGGGAGDVVQLMDTTTYEQFSAPASLLAPGGEGGADDGGAFLQAAAGALPEGLAVRLSSFRGEPIAVELPSEVELTVARTEPATKADGSMKLARLENGAVVKVPPFVEAGASVVLRTSDGGYVRRA